MSVSHTVPPSSSIPALQSLPHIPPWQTQSTAPLLTHSKWCRLESHTIVIPANGGSANAGDHINKHNNHSPQKHGADKTADDITNNTTSVTPASTAVSQSHTINDWCWVITPNFINVAICRATDHKWIVFYQNKYAVNYQLHSNSLAPVGGYIDSASEPPIEAAKREAKEECGYESDDWVDCHSMVSDANRGGGIGHLFVCFEAKFTGTTVSDDLEQQHQLELTTEELEVAVLNGEFKCQAWVACMALALLHYKRRYKK